MAEDDSSRGLKRSAESPISSGEESNKRVRRKSPEDESATAGASTEVTSGPSLGQGKDVCSVKRKLWEVDSEQVQDDLQTELKRMRRDESLTKSARWNFDFEREKPLTGDWQWHQTPHVPKFYKNKVAHSSKHVAPVPPRRSFMSGVICTVQIPIPISSHSVTTGPSSTTDPTPSSSTSSRPCTRSQVSKSLPTSPVSGASASEASKPVTRSIRRRSAPILGRRETPKKRRLKDRSAILKNFR